jgi:hypothetical protein
VRSNERCGPKGVARLEFATSPASNGASRAGDPVTLFSVELVADFQQARLLSAIPINA